MQVCNVLAPATSVAGIMMYSSYTPPGMTVSAGGGLASTAALSDINYAQNPGIYIALMPGVSKATSAPLYQVTAIGYGGSGGNNGSVAIVRSIYAGGTSTAPSASSGSDLSGP